MKAKVSALLVSIFFLAAPVFGNGLSDLTVNCFKAFAPAFVKGNAIDSYSTHSKDTVSANQSIVELSNLSKANQTGVPTQHLIALLNTGAIELNKYVEALKENIKQIYKFSDDKEIFLDLTQYLQESLNQVVAENRLTYAQLTLFAGLAGKIASENLHNVNYDIINQVAAIFSQSLFIQSTELLPNGSRRSNGAFQLFLVSGGNQYALHLINKGFIPFPIFHKMSD
jgi:hypothetical protein